MDLDAGVAGILPASFALDPIMLIPTLIAASFILGVILGARTAPYGLAFLVAIPAATSSLPFQLGLPNLALVPVYLLGFVSAAFVTSSRRPDRGQWWIGRGAAVGRLQLWVAMMVLTIAVASTLGILSRHVTTARPAFDGALSDFLEFAPPGLPGEIQTGYIALVGPLLFVVALGALRGEWAGVLVRRAFTLAVGIAVAGPVVQFVALTPWVRPDQRTYEGTAITGLVGFFQDPHSYAAFLVMAVPFCVALSLHNLRARRLGPAAGHAALALAAALALLFTNSRAGLVALLLALALLSLLTVSSPSMSERSRRWRKGLIAVLVLLAMVGAVLMVSPTAREATFEQLSKLGNPRMWEIVRANPLEILAGRVARLQKAWIIVQAHPIWGVGPNGFQLTPVSVPGVRPAVLAVHPHNYFVQLATEYGLVSVACFLVLVGMILIHTIGGAYRATVPQTRALLGGIGAGLVGVLTMSLVGHPLLLAELQAVFWTMSALAVATALAADPAQSRSSRSRPASKPKNGGGAGNGAAPPPAWIGPRPSRT